MNHIKKYAALLSMIGDDTYIDSAIIGLMRFYCSYYSSSRLL